MSKRLWGYICDVCTLICHMPITVKNKNVNLHFCKQECYKHWSNKSKKK